MNFHNPFVLSHAVAGLLLPKLFHIDDLLLSHTGPKIAIDCAKKLDGECDSKDLLTVTRGRTHEHLGMRIAFSLSRRFEINRHDFAKKINLELH